MLSYVRRLPINWSSSLKFLENAASGIVTANRYVSTSEALQMTTRRHVKNDLSINFTSKRRMGTTSRVMSALHKQTAPSASGAMVSQDEKRQFMAVFPDIVNDAVEITSKYSPPETSAWLRQVLEYNVPKGKQNRGLLTVLTYKSLVKSEDQSPENIRLAHILAWCIEIINAFFLVNDDIMDHSITRRGQVCWHKLEHVGLTALNDALLMENITYALLKKYFRNKDCYLDLVELFHESTYITACGQNLDLLNAESPPTTFTMDKYNITVANKCSHYTFYLPLAAAMHLAGIKDAEAYSQSKAILFEIGKLFQSQDDFIDCFGDSNITGKVGTDIQDNKCSWLAVACMQQANNEQKQIMLDCYGKNDPEKINKIKELYTTLNLPKTFAMYEEESYNMIKSHISQMSCCMPQEIFLQILNKIYKRDI